MSSVNTAFIKKAQQLLSRHGFEVKTSQLYEVFSELAGYKNYNVAKAKKVEFEKLTPLAIDAESMKALALKIEEERYVSFYDRVIKKLQQEVLSSSKGLDIYGTRDFRPEINLKKTSELMSSFDKLEKQGFHFYLKQRYENGNFIEDKYHPTDLVISFFEDYKYIIADRNIAVKCSAKKTALHILNYIEQE